MRYLITIDTPTEIAIASTTKESVKQMKDMMAQLKPEAAYFSTERRHSVMVIDIKDPMSNFVGYLRQCRNGDR